jgi:hypothetical protein
VRIAINVVVTETIRVGGNRQLTLVPCQGTFALLGGAHEPALGGTLGGRRRRALWGSAAHPQVPIERRSQPLAEA